MLRLASTVIMVALADRNGTPLSVRYYADGWASTPGRRPSSLVGLRAPSQFPNPTAQGFSGGGRGNCSTCTA